MHNEKQQALGVDFVTKWRHKRFCTCPYITSTPACLWEETREVKRKHQSTLEKWAYTDGTVQYFDRTDAEAEERKRRMQEACRQVSRLQQKLHNPGQRLHEPSEIKA